jgi:hypothetical protein
MVNELMFISEVFKNVILPFTTFFMVILSFWIAWRKGLFHSKPRSPSEKELKRTIVEGDRNIINILPSEIQKLAYDVDKFGEGE